MLILKFKHVYNVKSPKDTWSANLKPAQLYRQISRPIVQTTYEPASFENMQFCASISYKVSLLMKAVRVLCVLYSETESPVSRYIFFNFFFFFFGFGFGFEDLYASLKSVCICMNVQKIKINKYLKKKRMAIHNIQKPLVEMIAAN